MRRTQFQDLLYQNMIQPGAAAGAQTVVPTRACRSAWERGRRRTRSSSRRASFQQTDNPLDMVIQGKGFFQVRKPDGDIAYTRAGQFPSGQRRQHRDLATAIRSSPQITIPQQAQSITIAADGTVSYTHARADRGANGRADPARKLPESGRTEQPGRQSLSRRPTLPGDPTVGNPGGSGRARLPDAGLSGRIECERGGRVHQPDSSQRAYEANSKVVKAADEMYQQVNNLTQ